MGRCSSKGPVASATTIVLETCPAELDPDGNVRTKFSEKDPGDGTYWMSVTDGYSFISRYDGPNAKPNGKAVHDTLFRGTKFEVKFEATKF